MHRTLESWIKDFTFSDELQELEKTLTMVGDHSPETYSAGTPSPSPPPQSELRLEKFTRLLARYVTENMAEKIAQQPYLARLVRAEDLKRDNQILAEQVKHLLNEKKELEGKLKDAERLQKRYKRIVGNLYLKLE